MSWRVLVSAPYFQPVVENYGKFFAEHDIELVVPPVRERLSEAELLEWVADVDGAICGDDEFTERVLRSAPKLRVVSKWGTGLDSIDREAAARIGIVVCNTPDAFTEPVADTVLGYVLCLGRRLCRMNHDVRAGLWRKRASVALGECTLGVVGVGNIGKAVVRRARACGMKVLGNDVVEICSDFVAETQLEPVDLDRLLREADFVSLNCDLNPSSFHIIGEDELNTMKSTAFLINTSRGPVIDETALAAALQQDRIAGAALDVFEAEPLPDDSPLRSLENVLLAPHNANSSPVAWKRVHKATIDNLLEGLRHSR